MKSTLLLCLLILITYLTSGQTKPGLDSTFGNKGIVLDSGINGDGAYSYDVALQPDGKIVAVGSIIARYTSNGQLDNSLFGTGRKDINSFTGPGAIAYRTLIQPDSKILVIGCNAISPYIIRLKSNGDLDSSFGINGITYGCCNDAQQAALQPDGKIVVLGGFNLNDASLWRVTATGKTDSSFGINGYVITSNGPYSGNFAGVEIMADGRIVIGGIGYTGNNIRATMAMRFLPNGSFDTTLNHTGKAYPFVNDYCWDMKLQPDGKILLAGGSLGQGGYVLRLRLNGEIDSAYGTNGIASVQDINIRAIQQLADGRIICGGDIGDFVAARLKSNGEVDSTFGKNGRIQTDIGDIYDRVEATIVQPDGKVILAGRSEVDNMFSAQRLTLTRYFPDAPTLIKNVDAQNPTVKIYPNPTQGNLTITIGQLLIPGTYQIYSIDGRKLLEGDITKSTQEINIVTLVPGMFVLKIQSNHFFTSQLFTKN